jgi:predicted deacylase
MPGRPGFEIGEHLVDPGTRRTVDLPVSVLSDHTPVTMSAHVVHGKRAGPVIFVSAAIHGDEIIGVEIVRRLLRSPALTRLRGTLIAVPIVNSYGFMSHSRYLPDRRDLNRSFPGSTQGSLAARLAHIFLTEIVARSNVGIDLHSAAINRTNLPQIRISPGDARTLELAEAFGAPLILTSKTREGSLRYTAQAAGVDVLLYEAGEGLRFDEFAIRAGVSGILRVMHHIGMIAGKETHKRRTAPMKSQASYWHRAPAGGLMRSYKTIGDQVKSGDVLGVISDPFGEIEIELVVEEGGLIVGRSNLPVVNEGDGLFHIAKVSSRANAGSTLDSMALELGAETIFDEDEII